MGGWVGEELYDPGIRMSRKALLIKRKMGRSDYIKIEDFCFTKYTTKLKDW